MTGLRERNKAIRIEAILDAAVELFDAQAIDEVTTEHIAERARVSPATVYNLVGTRDRLLAALSARVVEDLIDAVALATARDDDPIAVAHLIVQRSVAAFTAHSRAYQRVVAAGRSGDPAEGDRLDASQLQVAALRQAQDLGILRDDANAVALGRQVYISWMGAMDRWASGVLDDEGFAIATRHGLLTVLAASAADAHRDRFLGELQTVGAELERLWGA